MLVPEAPNLDHYDQLVEWVEKHQTSLADKMGTGGVANAIMDYLQLVSDNVRRSESKKNWDLIAWEFENE